MLQGVKEILLRVGLKENEIRVYLTCLENKQGLFVVEVTQLTGLKRSSANLILERLLERGFVTYHLDGSRKRFNAESPEFLLFQFEDSLKDLRALIPLLRITSGRDEKTKVRFFEGNDGIEKIFNDILLTMKMAKGSEKEILAISSGKAITDSVPEHQARFIDKRVKERIPIRLIASDSPAGRSWKAKSGPELRKVKLFDPKKYAFSIEIDVYANTIALLSLEGELSGVIIENETLARSFKGLFNLLWDSLTP